MMCRFCSPLPESAESVELVWFNELVTLFGFNPTPQPEQLEIPLGYTNPEEEIRARCAPEVADGVVRLARALGVEGLPPELERAMEATAGSVTKKFLRPALAAAGVEEPDQYAVEFNTERIVKTTPDGFVMHDMPIRARRPWVATEQLDATQQIPVIRLEETP
jgi:hypothetical protein